MSGDDGERVILVDASVFITLAEIDAVDLLRHLRGEIHVPAEVDDEITDSPAADVLANADWISVGSDMLSSSVQTQEVETAQELAEAHLGREADGRQLDGDVAILTSAIFRTGEQEREVVVLTDDKPLRKTCKALSIPVSGSIGVLIRAVERGDLGADAATEKLHAMDEVGARLSASLVRRAERLIDEAASGPDA